MRAYLALIAIYMKLALREKVVLFFNYVLPLAFLFGFGQLMRAESGGAAQVVTMVLVIGILGNGLYGAGIRAVVERETNILRRYKVAPITPAPLLVASMVSGWLLYLPTFVLVLGLTHLVYGMPLPSRMFSLFVLVSLGTVALRAIGLIVASVANSVGESNVIIQLLYLPMLLLSGATIPISLFPFWLQAFAQFLPPAYLYAGLQGTMLRNESLVQNGMAALALVAGTALSMFISMKLFRWEKEEKLPMSAKVWIAVVFIPFIALGTWQVRTHENIERNREYERAMRRNRTQLIRGARLFVGDGSVIEQGAVLIRNGRVGQVFNGIIPDARTLKADSIDAFGKTLLPGLIDEGVPFENSVLPFDRTLAAYLYCGVTAVSAAGRSPQMVEASRQAVSGVLYGPELFLGAKPGTVALLLPPTRDLLARSLVQQIVPGATLEGLRGEHRPVLIPGESVHARLRALVAGGASPANALEQVTADAARRVGADNRIGYVRPGYEASFVIVEGNPLQDVSATEQISDVFFKGERLDRTEVLSRK